MRLRRANPRLTIRYEDELRLFPSRLQRVALAVLVLGYLVAPYYLTDFWLSVLIYAGIAAVGAIGLNLLTGYTGQISLGHAAFLGFGAYVTGYLGTDLDLPLPVWLAAAGLVGGLLGALIGPLALRLRGLYLVIVTLGLVFIAEHVFVNWRELTGGPTGRPTDVPASIGIFDFNDPTLFGEPLTTDQSWFWLVWGLVGLTALLAKNIVRTRPGRAMQAIRDRDVAAEVIGVSLARYKIGAFAISSAMAGVAGALFAGYQEYVSPEEWTLFLSIQYLAIIIVGGLGTVLGAILGALFVGSLPRVIDEVSDSLPLISADPGEEPVISVFAFNQILFGLLIVLFLIAEPRGLVAMWLRVKAYFKGWPFSY
jgi:branched-chain amino acid transport system permease protein